MHWRTGLGDNKGRPNLGNDAYMWLQWRKKFQDLGTLMLPAAGRQMMPVVRVIQLIVQIGDILVRTLFVMNKRFDSKRTALNETYWRGHSRCLPLWEQEWALAVTVGLNSIDEYLSKSRSKYFTESTLRQGNRPSPCHLRGEKNKISSGTE